MNAPLPAFLRLIRFAKLTALIAGIWTIFCAVLLFGLEMFAFLKEGTWHALPLSSVFRTTRVGSDEVYSTASIDVVKTSYPATSVDALLQIPVIVPLLIAVALLTVFYLWLLKIERRSSKSKLH